MGKSTKKRWKRSVKRPVANTLGPDTVSLIHDVLVKDFENASDPIQPSGLRDENLLESAVSRQHVGFDSKLKYRDSCDNAATLIYGICNDHPFHNGNKRTALVSGLVHLDENGLMLNGVTEDSLYQLMIDIARHGILAKNIKKNLSGQALSDAEVFRIGDWLRTNSRVIKKGERNISYAELWRILKGFGYELGTVQHGKVEVQKYKKGLFRKGQWKTVYKAPCPGDGRDVPISEIKKLRKQLGLTEADGVDSRSFYDEQARIDAFVQKYRTLIRRLAKT